MKTLWRVLLAGLIVAIPMAYAQMSHAAESLTFSDGTKIIIEGTRAYITGEDGTKTPVPDGNHELSNGDVITTESGEIIAGLNH